MIKEDKNMNKRSEKKNMQARIFAAVMAGIMLFGIVAGALFYFI